MSVFKRARKRKDGSTYLEENYTGRYRWQGKDKFVPLGPNKEEAERELALLVRELKAGRVSGVIEQLRMRQDITIGQLIAKYEEAGCPDRHKEAREGKRLKAQTYILTMVEKWWAPKHPEKVTIADCDSYNAWRRDNKTRGTGDRSTEIELCTLNNVLTWALRAGHIKVNPFGQKGYRRPSYQNPDKIAHCRDFMPQSADELHQIASQLFAGEESQVFGWAYLLEALTGMRGADTRQLRIDAKLVGLDYEPGFMDSKFLYIIRSKRQKGKKATNQRIRLDDPERPHIRPLLNALLDWRKTRFPDSPWFLPSPRQPAQPISEEGLTQALRSVTATLTLPKRTAHGARAYYTTARRCQGIEDNQIAFELGHSTGSGGDLVREVYGDPPANWQGLANVFTWVPDQTKKDAVPIAWQKFKVTAVNVIPLIA